MEPFLNKPTWHKEVTEISEDEARVLWQLGVDPYMDAWGGEDCLVWYESTRRGLDHGRCLYDAYVWDMIDCNYDEWKGCDKFFFIPKGEANE